MKFNFNETSLITGYIKELLREFNLPVYSVYREDKKVYTDKIYIDRNKLIQYRNVNDVIKKVELGEYIFNKRNNNYTKNLVINSSIYDSYTHAYLGDYLRFIRDYKGINLMPLYNCFSPDRPVGLNYSLQINENYIYNVNTSDSHYNYYIVPAKFDEKYTIKIDSIAPYELSCIIYTGDKVLDLSKYISTKTYKKVNTTGRRYAFVYSTIIDGELPEYAKNYWQYEDNLRILIKLPKSVDSSITILEGDYSYYNNIFGNTLVGKMVLDDGLYDPYGNPLPEEILSYKVSDSVNKLSLLNNSGSVSYPFADRLIEYLLGNTIDSYQFIPKNIATVQDNLVKNLGFKDGDKISSLKFRGFYDTWDDKFIKVNLLRKLASPNNSPNVKKTYYNILTYNSEYKRYETSQEDYSLFRPIDEYYDLLGYVDKDAEHNLDISTIVDTKEIKYGRKTKK